MSTKRKIFPKIFPNKSSRTLTLLLVIIFVGAFLMTGSMVADKSKHKILFNAENIIMPPNDYRYLSRNIEQNSSIVFSYKGNQTIKVFLFSNNSLDQDLTNSVQKDIDSYQLAANETTKISVQEPGDFTIVFMNANMTSSALITSMTCEVQWTSTFDMPSLENGNTYAIFVVGIGLSVSGTLLFIADQLSLQEKLHPQRQVKPNSSA